MEKERIEKVYTKEEDIWIIPRHMGYKDRKMAKWQGFILSDHADMVLEIEQKRKKDVVPKEKQSLETVSSLLKEAYLTKQKILVQMDFIENGLYPEDLTGFVVGTRGKHIYLQTKTEFMVTELACIRHVQLDTRKKWFKEDKYS